MLKVKTTVQKSNIAGVGLFADEFIPKGTIVWDLNPAIDREYTEEEYQGITGLDRAFLDTYTFRFQDKYFLCVDNSRFFNHADDSNCFDLGYGVDNMGYTQAVRDIQKGEEMTSNYYHFGLNEKDKDFNTRFLKKK